MKGMKYMKKVMRFSVILSVFSFFMSFMVEYLFFQPQDHEEFFCHERSQRAHRINRLVRISFVFFVLSCGR